MKFRLSISCLIVLLFGCNKFEYPDQAIECTICEYAESMNVTYKGYATGLGITPYIAPGTHADSLDITLEHIFIGLGPKIDSSVMFFKRTLFFHSIPTELIDTIALTDLSGNILDPPYDTCRYTPNTIYLYEYVTTKFSYLEISYKGYK